VQTDPRSGTHDPAGEGTQVVFLVGAPRSGTTLLYKALCLHPEVAWISNWARRFPGVPAVAALNRIARRQQSLQRAVWFAEGGANAYVYGRTRGVFERAFPQPVEGEPIYTRCGLSAGPSDEVDDRAVHRLRSALEAQRRWSGGRCLVTKRIANNRRIPQLLAAFPQARFVDILRDGRAVAYSLSRVDWWEETPLWWYGGTPRDWAAEGGDRFELCARDWVEERGIIERGLAEVPEAQVLRLTYESFVEQPVDAVAAVAGFVGITDDATWRRRVAELQYPNRNERWRVDLDGDATHRIQQIQGDVLASYGYAV
jgi:hypothetical protein